MIFEPIKDFADVFDAMPAEHPRRRILKLLDEAVRRDVHFIDRHPTTLFQSLWNRCWWYDCPARLPHYADGAPSSNPDGIASPAIVPELFELMENWRECKEQSVPGFAWLRSLRPLPTHLGASLLAVFRGHERAVTCVVWSSDVGESTQMGNPGQ